jgi:hypothetical protein
MGRKLLLLECLHVFHTKSPLSAEMEATKAALSYEHVDDGFSRDTEARGDIR